MTKKEKTYKRIKENVRFLKNEDNRKNLRIIGMPEWDYKGKGEELLSGYTSPLWKEAAAQTLGQKECQTK